MRNVIERLDTGIFRHCPHIQREHLCYRCHAFCRLELLLCQTTLYNGIDRVKRTILSFQVQICQCLQCICFDAICQHFLEYFFEGSTRPVCIFRCFGFCRIVTVVVHFQIVCPGHCLVYQHDRCYRNIGIHN